MRIGIDARFYGSLGKGLGRYTEKLIAHLERLDDRNDYFIFLREENFSEYTPSNTRFRPVRADFSWYGWQEQALFPRLLNRYALDLVHFPHFNVPLFYRRPFVVTIHDLILLHYPTIKATELSPFLYWMKYWVYRVVIASTLRRARSIFAVSQFTLNDLRRHYPNAENKLILTPEAADPFCLYAGEQESLEFLRSLDLWGAQSPASSPESIRPYVLYVGNAYPHKNLELILEVAACSPFLSFVFVGKEDYFYRAFQNQVRDRKLSNILFTGFVSDHSLGILYRYARLYLFPSLYEGFGLPALEACLYGLPVLASDRGSLREVLADAGTFFDPQDADDCLNKMKDLLDNEEKRSVLRDAGYRQAARYRWQDMAEKTLAVYLQSVKSKRSQP